MMTMNVFLEETESKLKIDLKSEHHEEVTLFDLLRFPHFHNRVAADQTRF